MIDGFLAFFYPTKIDSVENFFDYSSSKKKRMIKESAKRAGKLQRELIGKYNEMYSSK